MRHPPTTPRRAQVRVLPAAAALLAALALVGCGPRRIVEREAPLHLADTGLYLDLARGVLHPDVLPYEPQYPLWTDGARKRRWIRLPAGAAIDARDPDAWDFPPGTRLWKEFAFERRVETRFMQRLPDGTWRLATYVWTPDGRDALRASERGVRDAARTPEGQPYDVPTSGDCRVCHGGPDTRVLGFSALQLSPDRDPLAPHAQTPPPGAVDLAALVARGLVVNLPDALRRTPPRIPAATPRERAVLGYLHANCATCHGTRQAPPGVDMDLGVHLGAGGPRSETLRTTLGRAASPKLRADLAGVLRVAAGDPAHSLLWLRLASRVPAVQMPPLGTRVADAEASDLIAAWIRDDLADPAVPPSPPHPPTPSEKHP